MIFRTLFVTAFLFLALPGTVLAIVSDEDYRSEVCSDNTLSCSCTSTSSSTTTNSSAETATADGNACMAFCRTMSADTYSLSCKNYQNQTLSQAQGNVTQAAESTATPKRDPILPDLIVDIPGIEDFVVEEDNGSVKPNFIGVYVAAAYTWLIGAATLIAVVMMMIGGLQYAMARGKHESIEKAKKRIGNAIIGLILLLAAYNIAFLINPDLVVFDSLSVQQVPRIPDDNFIEPSSADAVDADPTGDYTGSSPWQDCMLRTFGATAPDVEAKLKTVTYKGKSFKIHSLVADDYQKAFNEIASKVSNYDITSIGSYLWRSNRNNTKALSFHSWGVAIDINPQTNDNCTGGSCDHDIPDSVVKIFADNNIGWGGNWKSNKDYMHFSTKLFCGGSR